MNERIKAIADDILVWGDGDTSEEAIADHDKRLIALLEQCQQKNIKLNKEKFLLKKTELSYTGVVLTDKGVKPDQKSKIASSLCLLQPTKMKYEDS